MHGYKLHNNYIDTGALISLEKLASLASPLRQTRRHSGCVRSPTVPIASAAFERSRVLCAHIPDTIDIRIRPSVAVNFIPLIFILGDKDIWPDNFPKYILSGIKYSKVTHPAGFFYPIYPPVQDKKTVG